MLNQEDLRLIGDVMDGKLKVFKVELKTELKSELKTELVPEIVTEVVTKVVREIGEIIDEQVLPQFDRLENVMASKAYVDEKVGAVRAEFNLKSRGARL